jgi:hypothetical protein
MTAIHLLLLDGLQLQRIITAEREQTMTLSVMTKIVVIGVADQATGPLIAMQVNVWSASEKTYTIVTGSPTTHK